MLTSEAFGSTVEGRRVDRLALANEHLELEVLTWGATIRALRLLSGGETADVVLGHDGLAAYEADRYFLGAVVGRYANRIAQGRFTLDGTQHELPRNDRGHTLHGGPVGFHRQVWTATPAGSDETPGVLLEHVSPDGAMGFPGTLRATCLYLLDGRDLRIELRATCDAPTVVNLTQHAYFNLAGSGTIEDHELWLDADRYLPVDPSGIPHSSPAPVAGTAFDFGTPRRLAEGLATADEQLVTAGGYDHCLLLRDPGHDRVAARLRDPDSGRTLEVLTDQPGIQLYTGHMLGGAHAPQTGVCLEAQEVPDGPNRPEAAVVTLRPGEEYVARTTWRLGVQD